MTRSLLALPLLSLVACGGSSGPKGGATAGLAVVASDYMSTVVSLVDPATGSLAQDDCLDSGAVTPTLSTALSGDVVLASAPQPDDALVLLDRSNSAITFIQPKSCTVTRQLSVATGFYANPHDLVGYSATKLYVTRFEPNPMPSGMAGANDQGNDLLVIDPHSGAVQKRIDLGGYATAVAGAQIQARPDRALLANGKIYVTLGNVTGDFMVTAPGRVVVIDPESDMVTGTIDLPAYKSCSALDYVEATKTLLVGCGGDYNAAQIADQAAQSAVVAVDIGGASPTIRKAIDGSAVGGRPLAASVMASIGGDRVLAVTTGDVKGPATDTLWALALDSGTATKVASADGAFTLGGIAWLADRQEAMVTDASLTKPMVRLFDVSRPDAIVEKAPFQAAPKSGLPPRMIGRY